MTKARIYHPLLNKPLPTIEELRQRCNGKEELEVLNTANVLAALRTTHRNEFAASYNSYISKPFKELDITAPVIQPVEHNKLSIFAQLASKKVSEIDWPSPQLKEDATTCEVNEIDTIRALLRHQSEFIEESLFHDLKKNQIWAPSKTFRNSAVYWKSLQIPALPLKLPEAVRTGWARRWALLFLEQPDIKIDLPLLLSSVMFFWPPEWAKPYEKGIITTDETFHKMLNVFARDSVSAGKTRQFLPGALPCYYDHHGLLEQANKELETGSSLFLVGPAGETIKLFNAICSDVNYYPLFKGLEKIKRSQTIGDKLRSRLKVSKNRIYTFTGCLHPMPGWRFNREPRKHVKPGATVLRFFTQIASCKKSDRPLFVISMERHEYSELIKLFPRLSDIPVIDVPEMASRDIIPQALAGLPSLLLKNSHTPGLGTILGFYCQLLQIYPNFEQALQQKRVSCDIKGREVTDPDHTKYTPDCALELFFSPKKEKFGLLLSSPFIGVYEEPFSSYQHYRQFRLKSKMRKVLESAKPFFENYIGNFSDLKELMHLHWVAEHLDDQNIPEMNLPCPTSFDKPPQRKATFPASPENSTEKKDEIRVKKAEYLEKIADIPLPTNKQTLRFASYLADSAVVPRKLTLYPKYPEYLYLDPAAGLKRVKKKSGDVIFVEVSTLPSNFLYVAAIAQMCLQNHNNSGILHDISLIREACGQETIVPSAPWSSETVFNQVLAKMDTFPPQLPPFQKMEIIRSIQALWHSLQSNPDTPLSQINCIELNRSIDLIVCERILQLNNTITAMNYFLEGCKV